MSLCSSETNKFSPSKGECGGDEDVAEAFESIVESAWIIVEATSDITRVLRPAAVNNHPQNADAR